MRLVLLVVALSACSSSVSRGPSWPTPTPAEVDGGESLAPRAAGREIATVLEDDKPAVADPPAAAPDDGPVAPAVDTAPASDPAAPVPDELLITEEIVIEVDD